MDDVLNRYIIGDGKFRVLMVSATKIVEEVKRKQKLNLISSKLLGENLISTVLLGSSLIKGSDRLSVRMSDIKNDYNILSDVDANGHVRGFLQINKNLSNEQRSKKHRDRDIGKLTVTKYNYVGDPFVGEVPLVSEHISDNFTYYLAQSEQIPSSIGTTVNFDKNNRTMPSGGFLIQAMPSATDYDIDNLYRRLDEIHDLKACFLSKNDNLKLLYFIFDKATIKIIDTMKVSFKCDCSLEKFTKSLKQLPDKELKSMMEEDEGAEIICNFCNEKYVFSKKVLSKIVS